MSKLIASALIGLCAVLSLCAALPPEASGGSMDELPTVRLAIGMPVRALKMGSTYHFGSRPGVNEDSDSDVLSIFEPYNLVYVDDGKELELQNIGGQRYFSAIMIRGGKVDSIASTCQHEKLTLAEAMKEAERLFLWFEAAGFRADATDRMSYVNPATGERVSRSIDSFRDAGQLFLDPRAKIEEMQLFSMAKGDRGMSLALTNARRMQAKFDKNMQDESHVATEREYYLNLVVTHLE